MWHSVAPVLFARLHTTVHGGRPPTISTAASFAFALQSLLVHVQQGLNTTPGNQHRLLLGCWQQRSALAATLQVLTSACMPASGGQMHVHNICGYY
jgi:hypothetical protein